MFKVSGLFPYKAKAYTRSYYQLSQLQIACMYYVRANDVILSQI